MSDPMIARDELQQCITDAEEYVSQPLGEKAFPEGLTTIAIPVDLARRVLAEMDGGEQNARLLGRDIDDMSDILGVSEGESIHQGARRVTAERDAALATLADVRAEHAPVNRSTP